tara:strand:- start:495 stop:674 length:180 start_codon:yes stop_codon:yes gene_type:complete
MYIGIVQYNNKMKTFNEDLPRIGHHPTSNLKYMLKWKETTEKLDHVDYCEIYKLFNPIN